MSGRNMYKGPQALMRNVQVKPGTKPQRIARNTIKYVSVDGYTVYRLHNTNIVTISPDGRTVEINTGGWNTPTTRDRICRAGYRVASAFGGRMLAFGQVMFQERLTIRDGVPVETPEMMQDAQAALRAVNEQRREQRKRSAARRKELAEQRQRRKFGNEWFDAYPAAIAQAKESRHAR